MNASSRKIMVYDIGGTNLRGAIYCARTQTVSNRVVKKTPNRISLPKISVEEIYLKLLKIIDSMSNELLEQGPVSAASIAFPGPIDREGRIVSAPGIWGRNPSGPINILNDLRKLWPDLPIYICNDLTAAGYRYVDTSDDSFCLVTVSTGIGNKIFIKGEPQLGPNGTGGEIGHAKVLFTKDAPICDCGEQGHLQAISSGRGVLMTIRHQAQINPRHFNNSLLSKKHDNPERISNLSIVEAFHACDLFTVKIVNESIRPLAAMLTYLHLALGLEHFVIIGGFALALGEPYRLTLVKLAGELCWETQTSWDEMIQFGFKDDLSGLIGAGKCACTNSIRT
ncbi:MAG: ROK family protein [Desulfuromonas sp.]|nr:ROK family protein [Desulfuromonas sp.]